MAVQTRVAQVASVSIRALSYFFLRWVLFPPVPAVVFTLAAIYVPAFVSSYLAESSYRVVADEVDVTVTDTVKVPKSARSGASDDDAAGDDTDGQDDTVVPAKEKVEVEVDETIELEEKPLGLVRTLLTGAPSPRSLVLSLVTFLINVACVVMVADRVYSERLFDTSDLSFVRLGYVSEDAVKLLVREPNQANMPVEFKYHLLSGDDNAADENADVPSAWTAAGGITFTHEVDDFTAVLTVPVRNAHGKTFEWVSSNNHTGRFTLPPKVGQSSIEPEGKFTFLASSCIVSRLPYSPADHALAIPGLRHLADLLPGLGAQFMLFLGDFIYADVPKWWGPAAADYRQKYRNVYASPDWPAVGQNLSWIHVLDDHEILNDWDAGHSGVYDAAVEPWTLYHTKANPPTARALPAAATNDDSDTAVSVLAPTWFEFTQGPASFFMLDTRSYRSRNALPADSPDKTMLGPAQLEDLLAYLHRPEPRGVKWKVIASSVPFTKNWPVNTKDTWGGFMAERRAVLEAMWDAGASLSVGVVVLSGDRHEFAATKFPPPEDGKWPAEAAVHEFSASPLNQFFGPIPTYRQTDEEDVMMEYINWGTSKFGAISIENLEAGRASSLKYTLYVDGQFAWDTAILAPVSPEEEEAKLPPAADADAPGSAQKGSSWWSRLFS